MEFIVHYDLEIFHDLAELSEHFAELLKSEVDSSKDKFNLALSGGNTPKHIFNHLAKHYQTIIKWNNVNFFWGDERCVPPNDNESNYKMTFETLLSKVSIPKENIFRIKGEDSPKDEAKRYSGLIENKVHSKFNLPRFDLIMLGLGEDGHTASIFLNQLELLNDDKVFSVVSNPTTKQLRISITGNVINNARNIVFIITGISKSKVVDHILNNKVEAKKYPASFIKPVDGKLIWLLDEGAASLLK